MRDSSAIMQRVRSRDTTPEMLLRRALWAKGLRYKVSEATLPGKPDIVLSVSKIAIFIDGDLWHGNQWRLRGLSSLEDQFRNAASKTYWLKKIRRNMQRDAAATSELLNAGWTVLRFWEKDILKELDNCVDITLGVIEEGAKPTPTATLPQKTFAEFFAGIGLMRMGLERQGWSIKYANDIDEKKEEMYARHFKDSPKHFVVKDVHKLSADLIPTVALATASFPCNDLSLAGARQGLKGKESSAFWGFTEVVRRMGERRPPIVLLENVPGFLTSHGGQDFKEALHALNNLGYGVDAFMINAAKFVPQSRDRLFVIGVLNAAASVELAPSANELQDSRPAQLRNFISAHADSIRWSMRELPPLPSKNPSLVEILERIPDSAPEWWSADRAAYLLSQMSARHREIAQRMIAGKNWSYGTVFRRMRNKKSTAELRIDGIAGCLRTPRGGSGRQILFKAGKGKYFARLITPREAARLMGADDFALPPSTNINQALFGFGDAVCVPVIEWIATYYLNPVVNELIRGLALTTSAKEDKKYLGQQVGA